MPVSILVDLQTVTVLIQTVVVLETSNNSVLHIITCTIMIY